MSYQIFAQDETDAFGASALVDMKFTSGLFTFGATSTGKVKGYRDGDFTLATAVEAPRVEYPFQAKGDKSTIILRQKYVQAIENIKALPPYSIYPTKKDAYLIEEGRVEDKGGGIGMWERVYCTLPKTRVEYEKFPFPYQYISSSSSLGTIVRSVMSQVKYEYFLVRDRAAFLPLQKLEMEPLTVGGQTLFFKSGTGNLTVAAPTYFFVSSDALIVAEDSDVQVWNHPIMYRATRYVPGPTLAFLGQTTNLPLPS